MTSSSAIRTGVSLSGRRTSTIAPGERVAILGPNGAGKTTLALHLNGILRAAVGSIVVSGLEVDDRNLAEIRRRVGLVFQDPNDQLFMPTVREDVAFGPANLGWSTEEIESTGGISPGGGRRCPTSSTGLPTI